jgi:hypothetical protein
MTEQTQEQAQDSGVIHIPENALVACPEQAFRFVAVDVCTGCPHFGGLQDRFPGGPHAFAVRYAVLCKARPTQREIKELA